MYYKYNFLFYIDVDSLYMLITLLIHVHMCAFTDERKTMVYILTHYITSSMGKYKVFHVQLYFNDVSFPINAFFKYQNSMYILISNLSYNIFTCLIAC